MSAKQKKQVDLEETALELEGIALTLAGLENQNCPEVDHLTEESLSVALISIRMHINRIADELRYYE